MKEIKKKRNSDRPLPKTRKGQNEKGGYGKQNNGTPMREKRVTKLTTNRDCPFEKKRKTTKGEERPT